MPETPSLLMSCAICLRLHSPVDPTLSNPVCPSCAGDVSRRPGMERAREGSSRPGD